MTTNSLQLTQINPQKTEAILELTQTLSTVFEKLEGAPLDDVSIFCNGTEVYRYRSSKGDIFWWGSASLRAESVTIVAQNFHITVKRAP